MFFSSDAPGILSAEEIATMLQRLASRHLTDSEIVAASLRRKSKGYSSLLDPRIDKAAEKGVTVTVGSDPYYVAIQERQGSHKDTSCT
jgi:hypothetical protein